MSESSLFKELIACCLGNQVSYEHALSAADKLETTGLLNADALITWGDGLPNRVFEVLCDQDLKPLRSNGLGRKFRFPSIGTRCLVNNLIYAYQKNHSLKAILTEFPDASTARRALSRAIYGMGPKQSSLFLRNIGFSNTLAVLDRHVLSYMAMIGLMNTAQTHISSLKSYEELESRLLNYATNHGHDLSSLDLSIWVVMRVAKKEKYFVGSDIGIGWT